MEEGVKEFKEELGKQTVEKFDEKRIWSPLLFCLVLKYLLGKITNIQE